MPIEEKNWKEIEEEYARAKKEKKNQPGEGGWGKCLACQGTGKATCPSCKGLGRNMASSRRSDACPVCCGSGKANCLQPGCQGGWVRKPGKVS
jgi:hypothetical protein